MIFKHAFSARAIAGGGIGYAIYVALTQGAKRGLFSNEAGMGSTPHAHALADVKDPHTQGTSAMIGVFIDTFIVLTMTALIVISTLFASDGVLGQKIAENEITIAANEEAIKAGLEAEEIIQLKDMEGVKDVISGDNMAQLAFKQAFGGSQAAGIIGSIFVAICLFFFAFSTILSWNYFGKVNFIHLFGKKSEKIYALIAVVFVFIGAAVAKNGLVWELTDMFNNLMVIPNVIALFALSAMVVSATKFGKKKDLELDK